MAFLLDKRRQLLWLGLVVSAGVAGCLLEVEEGVALGATDSVEQGLYGGVPLACGDAAIAHVGENCSGVLVEPQLVLYAAHCGTSITSVFIQEVEVPTARCEAFPGPRLPQNDIAYCLLARSIGEDTATYVPALGCELDRFETGADIYVVGTGNPDRSIRQGAATVVVDADPYVFTVDGTRAGVGVCPGDSGGPVLGWVKKKGERALRLFGLVSGGPVGCKPSQFLATRVAPFVPWIEEQTGLDISPCSGPDGSWNPDHRCTSSPLAGFESCTVLPAGAVSFCGPAYISDPEPAQKLLFDGLGTTPLVNGRAAFRSEIIVPKGSVTGVVLSLRRLATPAEVWSRRRTLEPYVFGPTYLTSGDYEAVARAQALNGHSLETRVTFTVPPSQATGCSLSRGLVPRGGTGRAWLCLALSYLLFRAYPSRKNRLGSLRVRRLRGSLLGRTRC